MGAAAAAAFLQIRSCFRHLSAASWLGCWLNSHTHVISDTMSLATCHACPPCRPPLAKLKKWCWTKWERKTILKFFSQWRSESQYKFLKAHNFSLWKWWTFSFLNKKFFSDNKELQKGAWQIFSIFSFFFTMYLISPCKMRLMPNASNISSSPPMKQSSFHGVGACIRKCLKTWNLCLLQSVLGG